MQRFCCPVIADILLAIGLMELTWLVRHDFVDIENRDCEFGMDTMSEPETKNFQLMRAFFFETKSMLNLIESAVTPR